MEARGLFFRQKEAKVVRLGRLEEERAGAPAEEEQRPGSEAEGTINQPVPRIYY